MKKKGFTLVELLAVIAIIAILTLMAVPAVIKMYNENVIKAMHIQESEIKEAADLYIEDHCDDPIDHSVICPSSYEKKILMKKNIYVLVIYRLNLINILIKLNLKVIHVMGL